MLTDHMASIWRICSKLSMTASIRAGWVHSGLFGVPSGLVGFHQGWMGSIRAGSIRAGQPDQDGGCRIEESQEALLAELHQGQTCYVAAAWLITNIGEVESCCAVTVHLRALHIVKSQSCPGTASGLYLWCCCSPAAHRSRPGGRLLGAASEGC